MIKNVNIFGVRHLSPGASFHLLQFLEQKKPHCVLIEGPADASTYVNALTDKRLQPPVALLGYTTTLPIETVLYPFARYSPELQAIAWAINNNKVVRFIDLPSYIMLKIRQEKRGANECETASSFYNFHNNIYKKIAEKHGENDYETCWERNFEHNLNENSFREAMILQSEEVRKMVIDRELNDVPYDFSYNLIREAFMRREIENALKNGFAPEEIVVVTGAYHVSGILSDLPPMSDSDLQKLPVASSQITLMPYSYLRLSSRTGYGAGNTAPCYFEMMWEAICKNSLGNLSVVYLSQVAQTLRERGFNASSASVIEAVRLANALASIKLGTYPTLSDLHDAVVTCFGNGDLSAVADAINRTDIGTATGFLPEGMSQTPVQENMRQELKRLKLTNYQSEVAQDLNLDLRENLKVKTKEAAFIDLERSVFLHRLQILNIHFAEKQNITQDKATWAEQWILRWTPEVEIEIVEANLKGETLEIAAAFELKEQLSECKDIALAAKIIRQACECALTEIFDTAVSILQGLLVENNDLNQTAAAAYEMATLIQYGDLRQFDLVPLQPILQQLFLHATLLLLGASNCDFKAAMAIVQSINMLEIISQQHYETVDTQTWQKELQKLALRDDLNTKLSGIAFAILLEHNIITENECAKEVSCRLSAGVPADLGAGWFEGLAGRNRYALLSRTFVWRELDSYLQQLDDEQFKRSVVFLRRAFADFEPNQKNSIAELLGDIWGINVENTAELLQAEFTDIETQKLDELKDFDFEF
ncbi:hypothetical protein FACS1894180_3130 [Bacteroidia bacterium]|nr:hypothetical protein FACS1894180_3130 [Bacteroidia bacterium]